MNVDEIVQQLNQERSKLDAAIQALEVISGGGKRRGRPPGTKNNPGVRKRLTMSAAARKRIAEATRKRWAAAKKSGKKKL
jgi:hypothetical protein